MTTLPTAWENYGPIAANAPATNYHAAAGRIWRVNVTTVTVRGPFGAERIPLERIIETRKAAA